MGDHRDLGPVRPDPELVDGGGTERVGGCEDDRPALGRVAARELADGRRLARPVDADDEDDGRTARHRRARGPGQVARDEERREFRPDGSLCAARLLPPPGTLDQIDREGRPDIAGDERLLDLIPRRSLAGPGPEEDRGGAT